jgi:hypothetical protein
MNDKEKEALDKAIETICDGFNAKQSLALAFSLTSGICKWIIELSDNHDNVRAAICTRYIDVLKKDIETFKMEEE